MNNLNSALIEGRVISKPLYKDFVNDLSVCTFTIETINYVKRGENIEKQISNIDIQTRGKFADLCKGIKDKGVRVVGKVMQDRMGIGDEEKLLPRIYIEAEHIEIRAA